VGLLEGKSIIVTGAAQGIGQALSQLTAREGGKVLAVDVNEAGLEETARRVQSEGGTLLTRICDVTDRAQVDEAVAQAVSDHGPVDAMYNVAAIIAVAPFEEQTIDDLQRTLAVSVFGTFNFMQACFPHMRDRGGRIINFGSGSGTRGARTHSTYAAAKEAIRGLSKSAANEWGRYAITVNTVIPMAKTPMFDGAVEAQGEGAIDRIIKAVPLGRTGDPLTDIAPVAIFLATDAARFMTGRTLYADGGLGGAM